MNHQTIVKKFLDYFKKYKHLELKSYSLIPKETDPSGLFTNSGMHPIKSYFLGVEQPPSKLLCSNQRCFRTIDIDDVGENGRTLTLFFMLGSWSIGDYWKEEAVKLAHGLLINGYKFDKNKLWASVFKGNKQIPKDKEAIEAWKKVGFSDKRIIALSEKHNFWSAGPVGPCGPSTEVYYDQGKSVGCKKAFCKPGCDCDRFIEIWNAGVFMEYNRLENGKLESLPFKSIDTGAGVERFAAVLQKKPSVFETDMFMLILKEIEKLSKIKYEKDKKSFRIILDHLRASIFLISDGVLPSKMDRGYVLRRLLRRMIRYSHKLNLTQQHIHQLTETTINLYKKDHSDLNKNKQTILTIIEDEYIKFSKTLEKGNRLLESLFIKFKSKKIIPGIEVFHLYDTYGFPIELTKELAKEHKFKIDEKDYEKHFKKHREISKLSATKKFKGGVGDSSYESTKLHTATHLLHAALRKVLGTDIQQKGSNITAERLRFDFNFDRKLTTEEIKKVENIVNEQIKKKQEITKQEMSLEEAKKQGALAFFEVKYKDNVTVYSVGNFSKEICGGPHIKNTSELGHFKIIKESSSAAGIRRIKAVLK